MFNGVFDCGERADDALVVCDVLVGVEGDVEVDLHDGEVNCTAMRENSDEVNMRILP
jgi:hypothetical protein